METILRIISGLEKATSGKVYIDGVDVTNDIPAKRKVNTIFQNFALFPHMTVWENINFGLKMHKIDPEEATKRIKDAIKLVQLEGFENRYPRELSGGQQQRVAIARGIVMKHKVLLLDESLCSLDLKLKREMQRELKKIQEKLGICFIYVTHDQDEALTMSDRIIIINKGVIEQDDTPETIYQNPKTVFVADFIGESNIIDGEIVKIHDDKIDVRVIDDIIFEIPLKDGDKVHDKIKIMVRPENVKISKNEIKHSISGVVKDLVYDGAVTKLFIDTIGELNLKVNVHGIVSYKIGDQVYVKIDEDIVPIRRKNNEGK